MITEAEINREIEAINKAIYDLVKRAQAPRYCALCKGARWVDEAHPDKAWPDESNEGMGLPCPICNTAKTEEKPGASGATAPGRG